MPDFLPKDEPSLVIWLGNYHRDGVLWGIEAFGPR